MLSRISLTLLFVCLYCWGARAQPVPSYELEDIATATHNPPQPGDRWRMNLYRVEQKPNIAELAWSPTLQNDFHVLSRMGEIVFTDHRVPKS